MGSAVLGVTAATLCLAPLGCRGAHAAGGDGGACFAGDCHKALEASLRVVKVTHAPVAQGDCAACHDLHGEFPPPRRTPRQVEELCARCHAELGRRLRESRYRHSALDHDGCGACHLPHGGDHVDLLKNVVFVSDPISGPRIDIAALCWRCHDRRLELETQVVGFTRFRDGNRNLHEVHVGQRKGRKCAACHEAHAADQPFHLRSQVPFGTGGWMLPLNFSEARDGGSCVVGCHRAQSYSRGDSPEAR